MRLRLRLMAGLIYVAGIDDGGYGLGGAGDGGGATGCHGEGEGGEDDDAHLTNRGARGDVGAVDSAEIDDGAAFGARAGIDWEAEAWPAITNALRETLIALCGGMVGRLITDSSKLKKSGRNEGSVGVVLQRAGGVTW